MNCDFCKNSDLEKLESGIYVCKNCGFGMTNPNDPKGFKKSFDMVLEATIIFSKFNPEDSREQIIEKVMKFLHKIQNHPTRPDGYCEFCEKVIK